MTVKWGVSIADLPIIPWGKHHAVLMEDIVWDATEFTKEHTDGVLLIQMRLAFLKGKYTNIRMRFGIFFQLTAGSITRFRVEAE
ncbi:hypothetical protein N7467_010931 [Penicillium canescens]|nr:hypothetical protein N7467_010931 [Penicillium canescens]